jgi:hypothetical protein
VITMGEGLSVLHAADAAQWGPLCGGDGFELLPSFTSWDESQPSWAKRCPGCLSRLSPTHEDHAESAPHLNVVWRWKQNGAVWMTLTNDGLEFRLVGHGWFKRHGVAWSEVDRVTPRSYRVGEGLSSLFAPRMWSLELRLRGRQPRRHIYIPVFSGPSEYLAELWAKRVNDAVRPLRS